MWPVFVFGTGRCGSTHIQRLITLSTCCWIWGEHGGFLGPLLESVRRYNTSPALDQNVFQMGRRSDDELIVDMSQGSGRLSWINRLDRKGFPTEVASLLDRTFRSELPGGWTEWGFKEILYGLDNRAPAVLLELFPAATAVFTFREPKATIGSMIRTWSKPSLFDGPESPQKLADAYRNGASIWKKIVQYFLAAREDGCERVCFVSGENLTQPVERILTVLGLPLARNMPDKLGITNSGPKKWPVWAQAKFEELFAKDEAELRDLFARASAQSNIDFKRRAGDRSVGFGSKC